MRVSKIWVVFWSADSFSHRLMFQGVGERQGQNTLGSESDAELVFVVSFQSEAGVTHWHLCDALSPASVSVSWVMHPPAEVTQWYVVLPRHWGVTAHDTDQQLPSLVTGRWSPERLTPYSFLLGSYWLMAGRIGFWLDAVCYHDTNPWYPSIRTRVSFPDTMTANPEPLPGLRGVAGGLYITS